MSTTEQKKTRLQWTQCGSRNPFMYIVRISLSSIARYESTTSMDDVKRRSTGMHSNFAKSPSSCINLMAAALRSWGNCEAAGWSDEDSARTACVISVINPSVRSCCCCRRCFRDRPGSGVLDSWRFLCTPWLVSTSDLSVALSSYVEVSRRWHFK